MQINPHNTFFGAGEESSALNQVEESKIELIQRSIRQAQEGSEPIDHVRSIIFNELEECKNKMKMGDVLVAELRSIVVECLFFSDEKVQEEAVSLFSLLMCPGTMKADLEKRQDSGLFELEKRCIELIDHYLSIRETLNNSCLPSSDECRPKSRFCIPQTVNSLQNVPDEILPRNSPRIRKTAVIQNLLREVKTEFFLLLLFAYEDVLEHLWLVKASSGDIGFDIRLVNVAVPKIRNRSNQIIQRVTECEGISRRVAMQCYSIIRAMERLGRDFSANVIHKIQEIDSSYQGPLAAGMLGEVFQMVGDFHRAKHYFRGAISLFPKYEEAGYELSQLKSAIYLAHGNALQSTGEYEEALKYHKLALEIDEGRGDSLAYSLGGIGQDYLLLEQIEEAIQALSQAIAINLSLGDEKGEAINQGSLGIAYQEQGRNDLAIQCHQRDWELSNKHNDHPGMLRACGNLGNTLLFQGKFDEALSSFERQKSLSGRDGDLVGKIKALGSLGLVYETLGQPQKALELLLEALSIAEAIDDENLIESTCGNIGNVYRALHQYDEAEEYLVKSLQLSRKRGDRKSEGWAIGNIAAIYAGRNEYEKAKTMYQQRRDIAEETGDIKAKAMVRLAEGNIHSILAHYEDANTCFTECKSIANTIQDPLIESNALMGLGLISLYQKNLNEALKMYQASISLYKSMETGLESRPNERLTFHEEQYQAYSGLEATYLASGDFEKALEVSDFRRSKVLIDEIIKKEYGQKSSELHSFGIEEMKSYAASLNTAFVVFSFARFQGKDLQLGAWIVRSDKEIVFQVIPFPQFLSDNKEVQDASLFSLVEPVAEGKGLLDDLFGNIPNQELVQEVNQEVIDKLSLWYSQLFKPLVKHLPNHADARLTIVPDYLLADLPFHLLFDPSTERYLFETYTVAMLPSIQALDVLSKRQKGRVFPDNSLFVGDPIPYEKTRLPFSAIEAKEISKIVGTSQKQVLIGERATKEEVKTKMEDSRFIHLACHGGPLTKKSSTYAGALFLTPDDIDSKGILHAEEIAKCTLNAELVVMSACESAKGRQLFGGVIGPIRAFLLAGAQSIVASNWVLPDSPLTIEIFKRLFSHIQGKSEFARQLNRSLDVDEALREVMREIAASSERHFPQKWGSLFVTGYSLPGHRSDTSQGDEGQSVT